MEQRKARRLITESTFERHGFVCEVVLAMHAAGTPHQRNGYVLLPQRHWAWGRSYEDPVLIDAPCHGGLTFAGVRDDAYPDEFWLGFDCAHFNDGVLSRWATHEQEWEYNEAKSRFYVIQHLEKLAEWLSAPMPWS